MGTVGAEHGSFEPAKTRRPEFVGSNQGFNLRLFAVPFEVQ